MSASLVGSEMCIRDRPEPLPAIDLGGLQRVASAFHQAPSQNMLLRCVAEHALDEKWYHIDAVPAMLSLVAVPCSGADWGKIKA
eukprot:10855811-Alexandrium_andersonii.AAC.1